MAHHAKIPMLPGYTVDLDHITKSNHAKRQTFNFKNGMAVISDGSNNSIASELLPNSVQDPLIYDESKQDPTVVMSQVPAWVAYDRKVLRFYAYFTESVPQSPIETERVRRMIIYFYLEDDSIHVAEQKSENSGLPQGVFLKRHRVPKSATEFFTIDDLRLGNDLVIYGRTFHIYDCDPFSRAFFESLEVDVGHSEEVPLDAVAAKIARKPKHVNHGKPVHAMKTFMEASLGKPVGKSIAQVRKFLQHDKTKLVYYCLWADPSLYGETRPYVMNFYLADDCVEVVEVASNMTGRDPFPSLLKKQRLPKHNVGNLNDASTPELSDSDFYSAADFSVGATVNVYGRSFFIYAVDEFTKEYMKRKMGKTDADFPDIKIEQQDVQKKTKQELPPHNGWGTEEDSAGSCTQLMPKQPKRDWHKLTQYDKCKLLIAATLVSTRPEDHGRQFVITYHLADDCVQIDEKQIRNSGFWSGKFLNKEKLKNEATGQYFKPQDFGVGKRVKINSFVFDCYEVDSYTAKFLAEFP